ncbi:beta-galactosidase-1-like protein 2 [Diorhabda carinulata]|uniref:beta-galactosidase-1-like protein 2 n=1 Tax=Diorhabda carinulata TaxID=1163345 RepID=UPI0025A107A9|nr:beta-galactosidase-1-like protein 2 [Diorhabda carinulata]
MSLTKDILPTLYEYYTENGIKAGLSDKTPQFTLNNKNITIYSGAFHYFRVPRAYWRDRLRKMRAAGLNTVETYIPWNLHEPQPGVYDFGSGGTDMEDFLHLEEFLKAAQEEDLLALVRPGPYICAEFEFGGFPSWILRDTDTVRSSNDKNYISHVKRWFNVLLPILALLQFQKGGPIVGFQIENEFGSLGRHDPQYLGILQQLFIDNNITELLYTADSPGNTNGSIDGVLQTGNVGSVTDILKGLAKLRELQPEKPLMVMETYTGWFDHWGEEHHTTTAIAYLAILHTILDFPSSLNMYMFIGSTSYGFMNGANDVTRGTNNSGLQIDTTSYDYDSPITEWGTYTDKYELIRISIITDNKIKTKLPEKPSVREPVHYSELKPVGQILLTQIIEDAKYKIESENLLPMEMLPINNNSGQSYGYVTYRKNNLNLLPNATLKISGYVRDTLLILVNGELVSPVPRKETDIDGIGFWKLYNSTIVLTDKKMNNATLDLVIENFGRNNYGGLDQFHQFKGLTDDVFIDNYKLTNWQIIPLEFKSAWTRKLNGWHSIDNNKSIPALYKFILNVNDEPADSFIDMREWIKGITIVNGFVLGRHFFIGPQFTLYLPAPLLKEGENEIVVFEHYDAPENLRFSNQPIYKTGSRSNRRYSN